VKIKSPARSRYALKDSLSYKTLFKSLEVAEDYSHGHNAA